MPPTVGAMKIERVVVYNPTIHHGYLLEKNRHPGRRPSCPRVLVSQHKQQSIIIWLGITGLGSAQLGGEMLF